MVKDSWVKNMRVNSNDISDRRMSIPANHRAPRILTNHIFPRTLTSCLYLPTGLCIFISIDRIIIVPKITANAPAGANDSVDILVESSSPSMVDGSFGLYFGWKLVLESQNMHSAKLKTYISAGSRLRTLGTRLSGTLFGIILSRLAKEPKSSAEIKATSQNQRSSLDQGR